MREPDLESGITAPLAATELAIGQEPFLHLFERHVLTTLFEYKGHVSEKGTRRTEIPALNMLIARLQYYLDNPDKVDVMAKQAGQSQYMFDKLLISMPMQRANERYEIALGYPRYMGREYGRSSPALELFPSKVRVTRRGGRGIDDYPFGVLFVERSYGIARRGFHFDAKRIPKREYTDLHPQMEGRPFHQLLETVRHDYRFLQERKAFQ